MVGSTEKDTLFVAFVDDWVADVCSPRSGVDDGVVPLTLDGHEMRQNLTIAERQWPIVSSVITSTSVSPRISPASGGSSASSAEDWGSHKEIRWKRTVVEEID